MANFTKINLSEWKRTPYFNHYMNALRCTYSITVNVDITSLKTRLEESATKLYPALIYCTTAIVNRHEEFRTSFDSDGNIGIWDSMIPAYTIFHQESETFSTLWSEWENDPQRFITNYLADIEQYGTTEGLSPKPDLPSNHFPLSCLPWAHFTGFNLNIYSESAYLLPIFTWGKSIESIENGVIKRVIPLSIQVHHAVCDGFHVSRFINELQELLYSFPEGCDQSH